MVLTGGDLRAPTFFSHQEDLVRDGLAQARTEGGCGARKLLLSPRIRLWSVSRTLRVRGLRAFFWGHVSYQGAHATCTLQGLEGVFPILQHHRLPEPFPPPPGGRRQTAPVSGRGHPDPHLTGLRPTQPHSLLRRGGGGLRGSAGTPGPLLPSFPPEHFRTVVCSSQVCERLSLAGEEGLELFEGGGKSAARLELGTGRLGKKCAATSQTTLPFTPSHPLTPRPPDTADPEGRLLSSLFWVEVFATCSSGSGLSRVTEWAGTSPDFSSSKAQTRLRAKGRPAP
ncbi:uncharacterized protein LOC115288556 isoform X1 [Suricata suricatta]|uniref:uncharacterized protein LOC115288556 isoform X1 n=1 Tax=Suricata suricatta TaxID=37032 RepID=UPI00115533AA|nr:uncharacterized protein LOC115288556 isoform X1 [Suricata suricatta]